MSCPQRILRCSCGFILHDRASLLNLALLGGIIILYYYSMMFQILINDFNMKILYFIRNLIAENICVGLKSNARILIQITVKI